MNSDNTKSKYFDFDLLYKISKKVVVNMNKVIDKTFYPVEKARNCSLS